MTNQRKVPAGGRMIAVALAAGAAVAFWAAARAGGGESPAPARGGAAVTPAAPPSPPALALGAPPVAVPTFHCIGLYWSPEGGSARRAVEVRYRPKGEAGQGGWKEGLPMRYNPISGTDEDLADYRGSIVHLSPDTTYEIRLSLAGTTTSAALTARTWGEKFPEGQTVKVESRDTALEIAESGTPGAWRVYDGAGATIDVKKKLANCVRIDASYVIVRGLTLKGATAGKPGGGRGAGGAIEVVGGHDIVIEDCDVSDWGRLNPATGFGWNMESAIYSRARSLKRLVVQRCRLHHPTYDGSTWHEPTYPTHTMGPQAISLFDTDGNHVIRYNECFSDPEHMYNDVVGGGSNGSFRGSPGHDSDIYGNVVAHCWDDGLEVEGGCRNVRVWGNYITRTLMGIGNAAVSIGPLYVWRNVSGRSQVKPDAPGYNFLKMGFAGGEQWMTGHQYIFHNTVFDEDGWLPTGGLGGSRIVKHTVSRNNILAVRPGKAGPGRSASANEKNAGNDFDHDLYNGAVPEDQEPHGVRGEPAYEPGAGFDWATKRGTFRLAPSSPGIDAGAVIPNFNDGFAGRAPDIGAHEQGAPPLRFGVRAGERQ